jgi:hypothetical protein
MKRLHIIGNDTSGISGHWPILFWTLCGKCNQEYRREPGWMRQVGPYHGGRGRWQYICGSCAASKQDAAKVFESIDNSIPPMPESFGY